MTDRKDITPGIGAIWADHFDGDGSTPRKVVVVCTTPRTGSHFLCEILHKAGVGVPFEYFIERSFILYQERFEVCRDEHFLDRYLQSLMDFRTLNGTLAFKLNYEQLKFVRWKHLIALPTMFIWLRRHNIEEQAISFCAARQTGKWGAGEGVSVVLPQSTLSPAERYAKARQFLLQSNAQWEDFFKGNRISPFPLWYEDIVSETGAANALSNLPMQIDAETINSILATSGAYKTNAEVKEQLRQALSKDQT